jgi:hypothetical protein
MLVGKQEMLSEKERHKKHDQALPAGAAGRELDCAFPLFFLYFSSIDTTKLVLLCLTKDRAKWSRCFLLGIFVPDIDILLH